MLRWLVRLLLLLLIGAPLALLGLLVFALEPKPLVVSPVVFTPANIERAKQLLDRNDPRKMREGVLRTIAIGQQDLDLAANYAASRYARGAAQVALQEGAATVRASFELPANPVGRYLNIDASLVETPQLPRVSELRIGRVALPPSLCNWLLARAVERLQANENYSAAADVVKQVSARDGVLQVVFEWNQRFVGQLQRVLVSADDQQRWQAYQARLLELTARAPRGRSLPLDQLLGPLLQHASQRAAGAAGAAAENRALIIVLAFYVNGKGLAALVPAARDWPAPPQRVVTLAGRTDFPQHFTISAALAATAGSPLADAVGLYKEVDDSRGGSGFSFNDIAADRAGTRFGQLAGVNDAAAARLLAKVSNGLPEKGFFPEVRDLPEFMAEREFKRRYGGIGQPAYQKLMAEIDRRVAALPLYR